jgi:hypothetical protein
MDQLDPPELFDLREVLVQIQLVLPNLGRLARRVLKKQSQRRIDEARPRAQISRLLQTRNADTRDAARKIRRNRRGKRATGTTAADNRTRGKQRRSS